MSTISRRAFLKTVGVGALSFAAMSVLAGCESVGTQVPAAVATIEGTAGNVYRVSDTLTVSTKVDEVAADKAWVKAYVSGYETVIESESEYEADKNGALKADAEAAAKKWAANVEHDTAEVTFFIYNAGDEFILAEGGKAGAYEFSGVKGTFVLADGLLKKGENKVRFTVDVPCNAETFDIVITLPNADKAVKYTFENTSYVEELDPSTAAFYALN